MTTSGNFPRVTVISPVPALETPSDAGGLLLTRAVRAHLSVGASVTVISPSTVATLAAIERTPPVAPVRLLGRPRDHRGVHRGLLTAVHRLLPLLPRRGLAEAPLPFLVDLMLDRSVRALIRSSDVIDMQWEEYGRLAPLIRSINPDATLTCMFHDVNDQKLTRAVHAAATTEEIEGAIRERTRNRRKLDRAASSLDHGFVLSAKDSHLLADAVPRLPLTIVPPPLVDGSTPLHDVSSRPPVVGFIAALRRHENRDSALRLATKIWPIVHAERPEARLRIIGGGLEDDPRARLEQVPGIELTGFIEDLEAAYSGLTVTASPIDRGAGVKFKVVESIVRAIPTITTTIGSEGIDQGLFALVSDDDLEIARAILSALESPDSAATARRAALRARDTYGVDTFTSKYLEGVRSATKTRKTGR